MQDKSTITEHIFPYKTVEKFNKVKNLLEEILAFNKNIHAVSSSPWHPPTDVYETPDEIVVKMAISGVKPDDFSITFSNEILTVSGFRSDASNHEKICFYQVEIRYGYFERSLHIPIPVDTDHIFARYNSGILQISLPKAKQQTTKTLSIKITFG